MEETEAELSLSDSDEKQVVPPLRMAIIKESESNDFELTCHVKSPKYGITHLKCVSVTTETYVNVGGKSLLHEKKTSHFYPHDELSD